MSLARSSILSSLPCSTAASPARTSAYRRRARSHLQLLPFRPSGITMPRPQQTAHRAARRTVRQPLQSKQRRPIAAHLLRIFPSICATASAAATAAVTVGKSPAANAPVAPGAWTPTCGIRGRFRIGTASVTPSHVQPIPPTDPSMHVASGNAACLRQRWPNGVDYNAVFNDMRFHFVKAQWDFAIIACKTSSLPGIPALCPKKRNAARSERQSCGRPNGIACGAKQQSTCPDPLPPAPPAGPDQMKISLQTRQLPSTS